MREGDNQLGDGRQRERRVENGRVAAETSKHRNIFRSPRQTGEMAQRLLREYWLCLTSLSFFLMHF